MVERRAPEMHSQASSLINIPINLSEMSLLICWYNLPSNLTSVTGNIVSYCLCYLLIQKEQRGHCRRA